MLRIKNLTSIGQILNNYELLSDILTSDTTIIQNKTKVLAIFLENSTRTMYSFSSACMALSLDFVDFNIDSSSLKKGESLYETILNSVKLGFGCVIIRTPNAFAPHELVTKLNGSVKIINAGDGSNEHPTQALGDLLTIFNAFNIDYKNITQNCLNGVILTIIGDILHSRVARSNIYLLSALGAKINLVSNPIFLPENLKQFYKNNFGVNSYHKMSDIPSQTNIVMLLRSQLERHSGGALTVPIKLSDINLTSKFFIMHPGPINNGAEITTEQIHLPNSLILEQTKNCLTARTGLLRTLLNTSP